MWDLRRYLKPYWKVATLASLCMIVEVLMDLLQPKYMADIVNKGVMNEDLHRILVSGVIMVGLTTIGLVTGVGCNVFASITSQNVGADIRDALFEKVQTFSFRNLDRFQTGSLITRMTNDVTQVQNLIQMSQQGLIRAFGLSVGGILMALSLSVHLGLILLVSVPILVIFLILLVRISYPLFSSVQSSLDGVNKVVQENLAGIRAVKAFVRSDFEIKRFQTANNSYTGMAIQAARVMAINAPVINLLMNVSIIAILLYGGHMVWHGAMPLGNLIACINYVTQILMSLMMVSMILVNISQAQVSAKRITQVLTTEPDIVNRDDTRSPLMTDGRIEFEHVSFSYRNHSENQMVLRDVSFEVEAGQKVAIVGSTGAGKSSLVNLIPRLYDATRGVVRVDGIDVRDMDLRFLRSQIGMVLQESILFSGTMRDNISFGRPQASLFEIEEAAKIAQAHDFIIQLPNGYDTVVGQRGVNLSGGQKQRIAIARALLVKPSILILDDSTSALDLATEAKLQFALHRVLQGATTILIAQRISSVLDFEKILVLEDGKLVGEGTHRDLIETCKVYQDIYDSQLGINKARLGKEVVSHD
ncbi:ABC transporter ATP-binding protein [Alicyclobacillus fastidiosus]|uniref:ABC transporter ATP-binding protein n=1 Tax=Alicyclobacillus fastidiosus TaxID=392011 RepID=A0ABV5AJW5_9BACL|nr:ABC transporter ATP-binding protein [Alicyclobacillus fastidiosus]WEH09056.1 ABC transporter ATP-binding protein [Alicyclobacillus fastidiosus]